MDAQKLTYNVPEAAALLGVSEPTLWKAIHQGEIPTIRVSNRVLIPIAAFSRYLLNAGSK